MYQNHLSTNLRLAVRFETPSPECTFSDENSLIFAESWSDYSLLDDMDEFKEGLENYLNCILKHS